jgi:hypothetical protein
MCHQGHQVSDGGVPAAGARLILSSARPGPRLLLSKPGGAARPGRRQQLDSDREENDGRDSRPDQIQQRDRFRNDHGGEQDCDGAGPGGTALAGGAVRPIHSCSHSRALPSP